MKSLNVASKLIGLALILVIVSSAAAAAGEKKDEAPFYKAEYIFDAIEGYPSCHGSTITLAPNGDLMAAWYSGAAEKAKDVAIFSSRIPKGGSGWTKPVIIQDTPDQSDGNPVLFTAPDGALWLFYVAIDGNSWNDCPIYAKSSADGGFTWTEPLIIRKKKGWMTRNKPAVLSDGRIILPLYDETLYRPQSMISGDNARTWTNWGGMTQSSAIQPAIVERADGSLFCMMRDTARKDIWQSVSADKGKTWKRPELSKLPNPDAGIDMVKLANGHLAIAFNDSYLSRVPLTVAISEDEGRTWKHRRDIETDPAHGEYSYPAIIQTPDGLIHVTYTYGRVKIKHAAFNEEWVRENAGAGK